MIENFTLDTDANPQNMNKLIEGINKNEQDISGLKTSVEDVGSAIGQKLDKSILSTEIDLNKYITEGSFITPSSGLINLPTNWYANVRNVISVTGNEFYCTQIISPSPPSPTLPARIAIRFGRNIATETPQWTTWREVSWSEAPVETIITTGFASGWSWQIKYSKTQENILNVKLSLTKNDGDIGNSLNTVYTLPIKPSFNIRVTCAGLTSAGSLVAGSLIDVTIDTNGIIQLRNISAVTASVRSIAGLQLLGI